MIKRVSSLLRKKPPVTADEGLLSVSGSTVPTNGTRGFQPGALFQDTTNGTVYVNTGTLASSTFEVILHPGDDFATGTLTTTGNMTVAKTVMLKNLHLIQGDPTAVADGNTAITAAQIAGGLLTMAATQARAPTVPTGSSVGGLFDVGYSFDWSFINLAAGAHTITVTAATGHTLVGKMTLAQNESGLFRTRHSAASTAITYRLA